MERDLRFTRLSARSLIVAALAAVCFIPTAATAQQLQSVPPGSSSDTLPSISERKLDAVAAALQQVTDIKDTYQQKIEESAPGGKARREGKRFVLMQVKSGEATRFVAVPPVS